ncbi:MAG: glycosyltransferase family 1 protein [Planctomycetota bacterium]|nr:MAG: glycosyltransferase family 1 protein [Planctomycetota bacterium]
MNSSLADLRLGVISCVVAARNERGQLLCNHSMGRLIDRFRELVPQTRLCVPVASKLDRSMNYELSLPREDVTELPPLSSVARSQLYYLPTWRTVRKFVKTVDALFIRVPFQLPSTLLGLNKPKLVHVVSNPYQIISASSDYRGLRRLLALRYAAFANLAIRRMAAEPMTRVATNGREMWDLLDCREGRVVVSSCIYEREMRPREDLGLGDPPRILFVGYLRPEKGVDYLLDAFEALRRKRPLKLTLVGGSDRVTNAEARIHERIRHSPFRDDITLAGMLDFGEPLFEMYRSHDVYVLPSLSEGTPRTLVEARSFGCPVVATRAGGIPSSVDDGKNGLLVEPRDAASLGAAIERLLDDESLRRRLIEEGVRSARSHSLEGFADELLEEVALVAGGSIGGPVLEQVHR